MNYYQTDDNGYLVGEFPAEESPLEPGVFLIPRGGVEIAPPPAGPNEIAQWVTDRWAVVPDLRGRVYWLPDRTRHEIKERGVALPAGALDAEPPKSLSEVRADKLAALAADRKRIETLPITGNQGGKTFTISHPEKINEFLMGGLSLALDPSPNASFTMLDDNGVEVEYTKALMGQIIKSINSSKTPALKRYNTRKAAIEAAKDAADLAHVDTDLPKP